MAVKDHGLTFDHFKQVLEKIMEATPEELLETANRYFQADRMVRLIVGKIDED
jgi:predicted Zn-dependent peptidase